MKRRSFFKGLVALVVAPVAFFKKKEEKSTLVVESWTPENPRKLKARWYNETAEEVEDAHRIKFSRMPDIWYDQEHRLEIVLNMDDDDPEKHRQLKLIKEQSPDFYQEYFKTNVKGA